MCKGQVLKPRRYWCSNQCVEAGQWLNNPTFVRRRVFERDKGVCSCCGFDAAQAERIDKALHRQIYAAKDRGWHRPPDYSTFKVITEARLLLCHLWTGRSRIGSHLWEADHIVAVVEGGGGVQLAGYRTLCLICHKQATAALASRRAVARREAAMPLLGPA